MNYLLKKDMPGATKGTLFKPRGFFYTPNGENHQLQLTLEIVSDKDWFDLIKTPPLTWEELEKETNTFNRYSCWKSADYREPKFHTEKQAKSAYAFAILSQFAANWNEGFEEDWNNINQTKYTIRRTSDEGQPYLAVIITWESFVHISFKTKELAELSLKHHKELWEDFWMM